MNISYKIGITLIVTYNDYETTDIVGAYKVLKDFEDYLVYKEYMKQVETKKQPDSFLDNKLYLKWLVEQGFLEEIEWEEMFL